MVLISTTTHLNKQLKDVCTALRFLTRTAAERYLEQASVKEGEAFVQHSDWLVLLQL